MVYEELHKLCFSCWRIGHRKDSCPLTIKKPEPPIEGSLMSYGEDRSTYQGALPRGLHDSSCIGIGSGTTKDKGAGMEEDKYGPWMLVTCRKPGQKKTNISVISRDHSFHGLGQAIHGLRQEPKGDTRDWTVSGRGAETFRPLGVGRGPSLGLKMMDKELEFRSSPSVKGKRDLARSRATKWMSKADIGGVSKHFPSVTTIWNSRSKNDNGECSVDPFQFQQAYEPRWAINLIGRTMEFPEVGIAETKAKPTHVTGWLDRKLALAWRKTFPLMEVSARLGFLPLTKEERRSLGRVLPQVS